MNIQTKPPRMTVDEYLAWAEGRPGRYELFQGEVFAMSPEVVGHSEIKGRIYAALATAIRNGRLTCHVLVDGPTVRINDDTAYEPDTLVYCGQKASPTSLEISNPVILVEILSPSTRRIDVSRKLADYFRLPSVVHYLIVEVMRPQIIHHVRGPAGSITTRVITEGTIDLDPPGLSLSLLDIYDSAD